jgi:hypothetical protein
LIEVLDATKFQIGDGMVATGLHLFFTSDGDGSVEHAGEGGPEALKRHVKK